MNFTTPSKYRYGMNVKLSYVLGKTLINTVFPNVEDMVISSKDFDEFEDAVTSTTNTVSEIVASLNTAVQREQFALMSEVNPTLSGNPTTSKDWVPNEMAKVWIVDKIEYAKSPGAIKAVALAQLMEIPGSPRALS